MAIESDHWVPGGSATTPAGWRAGTAACGLREGAVDDLALLVSAADCAAAGVFTRNRVAAAPVRIDRDLLAANPDGKRALVINSGVANACTGARGLEAGRRTQELAADFVGCRPEQVLLMSTGLIGAQLDVGKLEGGLRAAAGALSDDGGARAASAIMTTDTRSKHRAVRIEGENETCLLGGMAKGAGMIHPDMATMLAVITTDLKAESALLQDMLAAAVDDSFHRISVDGDTSTNDSVLLLANGASGVSVDEIGRSSFRRALDGICQELALEIVRDGEGASKLLHLQVTGARSDEEALLACQTIATSPLVKTAVAGGDPNWGRVMAAAGRSGAELDSEALGLWVVAKGGREVGLVLAGTEQPGAREGAAEIFGEEELTLRLDLGVGSGRAEFWTTDLTHDYVTINAEYHT